MIFSEIKMDENLQREYLYAGGEKIFSQISRVNIFIGANNSGKSWLLRQFFANDSIKYKSNEIDAGALLRDFQTFLSEIKKEGESNSYRIYANRMKDQIPTYEFFDRKCNFSDYEQWITRYISNVGTQVRNVATIKFESFQKAAMDKISGFRYVNLNYKKVYFPVLRGLRPLQIDSSERIVQRDIFHFRTQKDYNWDLGPNDTIFTGLNLYNILKDQLLGTQKERERVRSFEKFLQEHFFGGQDVSLVPRIKDDVVHVKIGANEFPIHELGDGIQAIIILTYPLFFNQDEFAVFYFEEPETHLHPGLQRVFIEALLRPEFSKFQYFFSTHSNHFLDLTLEYDNISVYSFEKGETDGKSVFNVKNVNQGDASVLSLLGVRNSSVFLSNCTIWVEGITDRLYIRKYLELYQKEIGGQAYKEDLHYSFVEYGGGNITHWSFLEDQDEKNKNIDVVRLCGTLMLIADSDNATGKKKDRHEVLRKVLGPRFVLLDVTEIENLLTKQVLKETIQQYCPKDSINFQKFEKGTYERKKLGTYLDATLTGAGRTFEDKSGTIKDKVNFCKRAISNMSSIEDISPAARKLAKTIYEFIKSNNK